MHLEIDFKYYKYRVTLKIKVISMFTAERVRKRFIFKHLQNRHRIIKWMCLTSQSAHDAERVVKSLLRIFMYVETAKRLHQMAVSWSTQ